MQKKAKKIFWIIVILVIVIIGLIFASWVWLSSGQMNSAKEKIFNVLPFPAAMVNGRPISIKTYITRYRSAEALAQKNHNFPPDLKQSVLNRLIEETRLAVVAQQHKVTATPQQIEAEYNSLASQSGFAQTLAGYGLSESAFKNEVIANDVIASNLLVWFYSQRDLNSQAYSKADEILNKLGLGQKMADLAKIYSDDGQTQIMGGDTGFIGQSQILPEVVKILNEMKPGDQKVIATRYGIEVVQLDQQDKNGLNGETRWHLEQIYLAGSNFENWYNNQIKNFKIIKIVSL